MPAGRGRKTLSQIREQVAQKLERARAAAYIRKKKAKERESRRAKSLAKSKSAPQLERGEELEAAEARLSKAMTKDGSPTSTKEIQRHNELLPLEVQEENVSV